MEAPQHRTQEGKRDWFGLFRHSSKHEDMISLPSTPSPDSRRECGGIGQPLEIRSVMDSDGDEKLEDMMKNRTWTTISPTGLRPAARCDHAATVIGRKMLIVGGESANRKLNDVHMLHLGTLTWSRLGSIQNDPPTSEQLPPCKGHSLISWGKTALLVGGEMNLHTEKVTVWSFDIETEHWTKVQAKGDIPAARSGQSVTRAGSILVMFGGEDQKGRMLNDLHVLDLKSLMWLPLHTVGKGPSPRAKHVATMYDDRYLLVFGGASKSKVLNDLYALDFETMMWSRMKPSGLNPSPRSGSSGALVNDKWYISGGAQRGIRVAETITLDISKMAWINVMTSPMDSVASNQRLSLVLVQKKDRTFLVAFGGYGVRSYANEVQVLYLASPSEQENLVGQVSERFDDVLKAPFVAVSPCDQRSSVLAPLLDPPSSPEPVPGLVPLRKIHSLTHERSPELRAHAHFGLKKDSPSHVSSGSDEVKQAEALAQEGGKDNLDGRHSSQPMNSADDNNQDGETDKQENERDIDAAEMEEDSGEAKQVFWLEEKLALALKKADVTEAQLDAVQKEKEEAEKKLSVAVTSQQSTEAKLGAAMKELEELRRKLEASELVQEESNSLSNIVHAENLRLEHDLSFLKAVLEETQKELHSTRGVLTSERSRAFQLQVELFELKQKSR